MHSDVIDNIQCTFIAVSAIHGDGLFSETAMAAGHVLANLDGQVVPWAVHERLNLVSEWNALPNNRLLVRPYKTKYYFINHSRTPNTEILRSGTRQVQVVALRDIAAGEELTLDYRKEPLPESYLSGHGATYL